MTIEAVLESIDKKLGAIHVLLQSKATGASLAEPDAPKAEKPAAAEGEAPKNKGGRPRKTFAVLDGDAEGTRYWDMPKQNSVYKQAPGGADPTGDGAVLIAGDVYTAKKAEYAKKSATATTTANSSTGSAKTSVSDKDLGDLLVELHASTGEGMGKEALKATFQKFIPGHTGKMAVAQLVELKKNKAIYDHVYALLNPVADDGDDLEIEGGDDDLDDDFE